MARNADPVMSSVLLRFLACPCFVLLLSGVTVTSAERTPNLKGSVGEKKAAANGPRDVVVCRGVGDLSEPQWTELGNVWSRYAREKVITATSPLLYKISESGSFESLGTPKDAWEEKSQQFLMTDVEGVKVLPHVWCDASCCKNCPLPDALTTALKRKDVFFKESVDKALKFGWDGYALDFEGAMPGRDVTTQLFKEWRTYMAQHNGRSGKPLELHLWTGSGTDEKQLATAPAPFTSAIDMSTYYYQEAYNPGAGAAPGASLLSLNLSASSFLDARVGSAEARYCPPGSAAHDRRMAAGGTSSLLQGLPPSALASIGESESASTNASLGAGRVRQLNEQMHTWCTEIAAAGRCAFGLITYDLSNAHMNCKDLVQVGAAAQRENVGSIWIWSGGVVNKYWEPGLRHYVTGASEMGPSIAACDSQDPQSALALGQQGLGEVTSKSKGAASTHLAEASLHHQEKTEEGSWFSGECKFDAHYRCNGDKQGEARAN